MYTSLHSKIDEIIHPNQYDTIEDVIVVLEFISIIESDDSILT